MSRLPLVVATGNYDRVRAIIDGRVAIEGCDVNYIMLEPEETFFRAFGAREFKPKRPGRPSSGQPGGFEHTMRPMAMARGAIYCSGEEGPYYMLGIGAGDPAPVNLTWHSGQNVGWHPCSSRGPASTKALICRFFGLASGRHRRSPCPFTIRRPFESWTSGRQSSSRSRPLASK